MTRRWKLSSFLILSLCLSVTAILWHINSARAAVITWDGGGTDGTCGGAGTANNWSCGANWSGDVAPGTSDIATFSSTSTKDATINADISVLGIDINTGYTGTITQGAGFTVTVGTSHFDISAGTFTGGNSLIDINGAFTVSGGTFNNTSGNLQVTTNFTISSGTFNEGTGTVVVDTSSGTINVVTTETFYKFTINRTGGTTISSGDTIVVTSDLTLTNGSMNTGTIDSRGNTTIASTFDGGTGVIDFGNDSTAQTMTISGGIAPGIRLNSAADASDAVTIDTGATTVALFNVTSGFSGTIPLTNNGNQALTFTTWTQDAGTYDASAQSSWIVCDLNISAGTFTAPTTVTTNSCGNRGWDINSSQTFNNLTFNHPTDNLTITSGDTLVVTGTLTLTDGVLFGGTIDTRGNISEAATFDGGTTVIDFGDNSVAQTYTINGGTALNIRMDNASDANDLITVAATATLAGITTTSGFSGSIPLSNASNFTLTITSWTQAGGNYDASSQSSWTLLSFSHTAGSFTAPTTITSQSGGGNRTWDLPTTDTFQNVVINNVSDVLTIGTNDILVVTGTLTLTDGIINSGSIDARTSISAAATFDGGTTIIDFGNDSSAQTFSVAGGAVPVIRFDDPDDANDVVTIGAAATIGGITATSGFSGAIPLSNGSNFTLTVSTWNQAAGTYDASAQTAWTIGTFTRSGGTFTAPTTVTTSTSNATWDVATSQTFNNLTINVPSNVITIGSNDTLYTTGTLTLTDGVVNNTTGLLSAQGNVTMASTWDGGSAPLEFSGSATQTFTITGGTGLHNSDLSINKTGGQVNLATALIMDAASQDLNIVEGKLNLAGNNLTVNGTSGTFVVQDGGNFQLRGSETITLNATYPTLSTGSTVTYTGDGDAGSDTYTITTLKSTYHHLVINSTDGATDTFQLGAALDVNGDMTITAGTVDVVSGQNYAITLAGNWSNSGSFNARAGTVTLDPDVNHTFTGATTWYNLTYQNTTNTSTNVTLTLPATVTQTIGGALTLDGLDGNDLILVSSSSGGSVATIDFTGSSTFTGDFLQVTDNTATDNSSGVSVPLNPTSSIDGGNTTGWFTVTVTVSGVVYTDEGATNIGTGKTVRLLNNGADTALTGDTDGSGTYSIDVTSLGLVSGDILTLYIDDETENGVTVTRYSSSSLLGADIYQNYLLIRSEDGSAVSNTNLDTADNADPGGSSDDISSIYSVSGGTLTTASSSIELLVNTGDTYTPGGAIDANGNLDINGTLTAAANAVNVAGSFDNAGTFTHTGTLTFDGTSSQAVISGGSTFGSDVVIANTAAVVSLSGNAFNIGANDLTVNSNAIFSLAGQNLTATGTFANNGTVRLQGAETVTITQDTDSGTFVYLGDGDGGADTFTMTDFGSPDYYNLTIATTDATDVIQSGAAKVVAGTLGVSSGRYNANGNTTDVTGLTTLSGGTYTASTATQTLTGLTLSGGTFTGSSGTVDVNGALTISSGAFTAPSGSLTIQGNFSRSGTFTHNSGSVTFDPDANHSITGSTTWNNLTLQDTSDNATDVTLTIAASSTQTIAGILTLDGLDATDRLNIVSSSPGTEATTAFSGSSTFSGDFLDITDNVVTDNSSGIDIPINPANTVNGGNANGWFVTTISGRVFVNESINGIGADITVRLLQNGVDTGVTDETDSSSDYLLDIASLTVNTGDILTLYLDDETANGVVVTRYDLAVLTDVEIYQNFLVIRSEDGSAVTNTNLDTADNADPGSSSNDISSIYSVSGGNLTMGSSVELWIHTGDTFTPGGAVDGNGNIEMSAASATFNAGSNAVSVSGTFENNGTFTHTGTLTFDGTTAQLFIPNTATIGSDVVIANTSSTVTLSGSNLDIGANDLTINSGAIFVLGNRNLTATGTFSNEGTLRFRGTETVTLTQDADSGTFELLGNADGDGDTFTLTDWGTPDYYNLKISTTDAADVFQAGAAKAIAGTLTITAGTYDANGNTTSVSGLTTVSGGTYTASTATQTLAALTVSGGTFTGSSGTVDVNGTLTISSGVFTAPSSLTLQGDFSHTSGTFTHNSGTVTLDANANHAITGDNTWNNLTLQDTADNATDVVLTIAASSTQTIDDTLTLDGLDASDRLNIVSSSPGTASVTSFVGASTFSGDFLDITDNTVTDNSTGVSLPIFPANSVDGGNTNGWFNTNGVTVSAISGNTTEAGGTATFTVVLDAQPTGDVVVTSATLDSSEGTVTSGATLTFTTINWATPQTVTVTGVNDDVDDGDIAYTIQVDTDDAATADGNYDVIDPDDVAVTNTDNDTAGVTVSAISGNTTEAGGTATFTVVLDSEPTGNVEVDSVTTDATEGTVTGGATLTFTTANWDTPQTVTVTGVNDDVDDGNIAYSITVTTDDGNTADALYDAVDPNDVSVTNNDNDTAGVTVSAISGHTTEAGGTATFTVVLDSEPTGNVEIDSASDDATEGLVTGGATLTFTTANWDTPQTVTVTGQDDLLADGDTTYHIVVETDDNNTADGQYDAIDPNDVTVVNDDDDGVSVTVSAISGNTTEAGGTATFTVVLDSEPTGNVEIDSVSDDATEGAVTSGATLTFTTGNWDTPQTVTVTGADDDIDDGNIAYNILVTVDAANTDDAAYDAVDPDDVAVTNTDNDTAGVTVSLISGNTTEAAGTATFTVVLNTEPTGNVEIDSVTTDSSEGTVTGGATLTFTTANWDTPQTVTVTGVNDDVDDGNVGYSITVSTDDGNTADAIYDAVDPDDVSVTNTDNDTAAVAIIESAGTTDVAEAAETTDTYTVVLTSEPTADVTVTITDDADADASPSVLTFTSGNWDTPQTVTVTALDDDIDETSPHTATISHVADSLDGLYDGIAIDDVLANVTDDDTSAITVSAISGNTTEAGGTATFTVVLETQPSTDVVINLDTDDDSESSVDQAVLTFTNVNWDTPQTVTVTGEDDDIDDGDVSYQIVLDPASSLDMFYDGANPSDVDVVNTDDDTAGVTIVESGGSTDVMETGATSDTYTVVLDSEPTANVTITISHDADVTVLDTSLVFMIADWDTPQTVTVSAVDDADDESDFHTSTLTHAADSLDGVYDGSIIDDVVVNIADDDTTVSGGDESDDDNAQGNTGTPIVASRMTIEIDNGARTTANALVMVTVTAEDAESFQLSNTTTFTGARWVAYEDLPVTVDWDLGRDFGLATVYARFRSLDGLVSSTISDTIEIVPDLGTVEGDTSEEDGSGTGETETDALYPTPEFDQFTRFVRTQENSAMYAEDSGGVLHPIPDLATYLSYANGCNDFAYTDTVEIQQDALGAPLFMNANVALVKFVGKPEVYVVEPDPTDPLKRILRWLVDEKIAIENFGEDWKWYVIEVPESVDSYRIDGPITSKEYPGTTLGMRSRAALTGSTTYELSIALPDGTRRNGFGPYAKHETLSDGVSLFSFEDREDFDFDDVVLQLDPTNCLSFEVSALPSDAAMHHQVWLTVYWDGIPRQDILVFDDSKEGINTRATIDITNEEAFGVTKTLLGIEPRKGLLDSLAEWIRALFQ